MKRLVSAMLLAAATSALAVSATRVGPVSTYGELKAAKINNVGQLVGSCPTYASTPVQVKGMSLFWSSAADSASNFYTEKAVNLMVSDMNIEVIRFAMGVSNDFDKGRGYLTGGEALQKAYLKNVVNAAIDNDIYVIIDWHIESSTGYTSDAVSFFEYAAQQYGSYNNVIFEVWNEPTGDMSTVATHANTVIAAIRKYSDNLILVGSPSWSSQPNSCASAGIQDSQNNFACTLHFYAATHKIGGGYDSNALTAMNAGIPVFVSEWGTVDANGNGTLDQSSSQQWISWMNDNHISWANWSASAENEKSAAFTNLAIDNGLTYSTSGSLVKGWMNGSSSYKDCGLVNGNATSSSGYSIGVANGTTTDLIDDMEDGDRYAYTGGFWSAFADSDDDTDGQGKTSITNSKWTNDFGKSVYDVLMASDGGKNTSKNMVGLTGIKLSQGNYKYAPYVAIGLNLKKDTSDIDLSKCTSISYKYKGASHNFRVEIPSMVTNWNFHHVNKDAADDWKEVELSWDQFTQESWGDEDKHFTLDKGMNKVRRFAWEVKGALDVPDAQNQPKYDYLYVDDVRCNGASITAIAGTSSATTMSSSSTAIVSSSSATTSASSSSAVSESSSSIATTAASSSAVMISSSSNAVVNTTIGVFIDDVEDGDEILKTNGTWYAYTDKEPGGLSSITNIYDSSLPGYVVTFLDTMDPTNGTQGFVGLTGIVWNQGTYTEAPFVALGLNTNADTSKGVDFSSCDAFSYRYKGAAHSFKVQDGTVTDYAYHYVKQDTSSVWTEVTIPFDDLEQPSWTQDPKDLNYANIKKMSWEVIGYKGFDLQPTYDYLYIDDVKCVKSGSVAVKSVARAMNGIKMAVRGKILNVAVAQSGNVKVQVFDMMGHVVETMSQNMAAGNHAVSLENLGAGNYVVRVMNNSAVSSARVSIK